MTPANLQTPSLWRVITAGGQRLQESVQDSRVSDKRARRETQAVVRRRPLDVQPVCSGIEEQGLQHDEEGAACPTRQQRGAARSS